MTLSDDSEGGKGNKRERERGREKDKEMIKSVFRQPHLWRITV